ncbi:MAG: UDP-N-acetylmuramoyl-L-alanyl-D-glutamate--2,6-diaminopimelate ligase [Anaerolineae bacterium]|nr:UDP-N-acetylmuramoyl-L-alanyl-D-glutamate--2,6-diaminopimelate ligase [Anaerolineae bacterium]
MTDHTLQFSDLLNSLPGLITAPQTDVAITAPVSENAQTIQAGGVFLARKGARVDGHDLIAEAVENGAVAVVGERSPDDAVCPVPYAQVADGMAVLGPLAAVYYDYPAHKLTVIGVTGTDGKTTTAALIHSMLHAAGFKAGMISTVSAIIGDEELPTGLHVTTPPAHEVQMYLARMVTAGLTHVILEATSHGLAQGRVNGVAFDVVVMTNITHEHLDFHGTWEQYRRDKGRLFEMVATTFRKPDVPKLAIINADDQSADLFTQLAQGVDRIVTYALDLVMPADVRAEDIEYGPEATTLTVHGPDWIVQPVETHLVGPFNVANVLAAAAVVGALLSDQPAAVRAALVNGVQQMPLIPGRMERIHTEQDFLAIVDFAHTPNALRRALEAARTMIPADRRVIAIFGSAGLRDRDKRRMMAEIGMELADLVVLTAEDPRTESLAGILNEMAQGCRKRGGFEGESFWRVMDRGKALAFGCSLARQGDLVIACGKGHEQSMCFGSVEYPWDDREAMRAALRGEPLLTLPTAGL